jgi:threonylcarbamoyladenosine tRNA methylthiotransferase MtaB
VQEMEMPYLHVFPYSERPGTPASRMPAVAMPVRRERAARLRQAGGDIAARFLASHVGRVVSVLTEADQSGHSEHFAPVRLGRAAEPGTLLMAKVTGTADGSLLAEAD